MARICVFCASSQNIADQYYACAEHVARLCADQGYDLVYGGSQSGLMGRVADSAMERGVHVIGVIPETLHAREVAHEDLDELHVVEDMHARQKKMADLSDVFIILPGGVGTLAELFEVLTWKQLGLHEKPIILLNIQGYWSALIEMMEKARIEGFLYSDFKDSVFLADTVEDIRHYLNG